MDKLTSSNINKKPTYKNWKGGEETVHFRQSGDRLCERAVEKTPKSSKMVAGKDVSNPDVEKSTQKGPQGASGVFQTQRLEPNE